METSMLSIEMAVSGLPSAEASTISTLAATTTNYARTSINTINTAEKTRASSSNNNLNSFVAARTDAQVQMDTLDSIETAVTTGFSGRYTDVLTTTRSLLDGKYGGAVQVDATPDIVKNKSNAYYGRSCAASGAYFACGAYYYESGLVAIYKMDVDNETATLLQIVKPKLIYAYSYFGFSLDMDGDLLVIGAYNAYPGALEYGKGVVWVMKRDDKDNYVMLGNVSAATATCK
jgi:hypothetical protein